MPCRIFRTPLIAESLLTKYAAELNRHSWKNQESLETLMNDWSDRIQLGIENLLKPSYATRTRCEFVWSYYVCSDRECPENESRQQTSHSENGPQGSSTHALKADSVIQYFKDAFHHIEKYRDRTNCIPKELFSVFDYNDVKPYILTLLNGFVKTICNVADKISNIITTPCHVQVYSSEDFLQLQDFVNVYVAEVMLRCTIRGDLVRFHKSMERFILNNLDNAGILPGTWPFDSNAIWKTETGLLQTNISPEKVFPDSAVLHLIYNNDLRTAYNRWYKKPENATRDFFCQQVIFVILQRLLSIRHLKADNEEAVGSIWKNIKYDRDQQFEVLCTRRFYKSLLGLQSIKPLAATILTLTHVRRIWENLCGGGMQFSLAVALDLILYDSNVPFIFGIPKRTVVPVFIPITFNKHHVRYDRIYQKAFEFIYHRNVGTRNIPVRRFINALTSEISKLPQRKRPVNFQSMFSLINQLLDDAETSKTPSFQNMHYSIRDALSSIRENGESIQPANTAGPSASARDLRGQMTNTKAKCSRSSYPNKSNKVNGEKPQVKKEPTTELPASTCNIKVISRIHLRHHKDYNFNIFFSGRPTSAGKRPCVVVISSDEEYETADDAHNQRVVSETSNLSSNKRKSRWFSRFKKHCEPKLRRTSASGNDFASVSFTKTSKRSINEVISDDCDVEYSQDFQTPASDSGDSSGERSQRNLSNWEITNNQSDDSDCSSTYSQLGYENNIRPVVNGCQCTSKPYRLAQRS
ncbi:unnamed protein product, partial [Orchesella dallaii]